MNIGGNNFTTREMVLMHVYETNTTLRPRFRSVKKKVWICEIYYQRIPKATKLKRMTRSKTEPSFQMLQFAKKFVQTRLGGELWTGDKTRTRPVIDLLTWDFKLTITFITQDRFVHKIKHVTNHVWLIMSILINS